MSTTPDPDETFYVGYPRQWQACRGDIRLRPLKKVPFPTVTVVYETPGTGMPSDEVVTFIKGAPHNLTVANALLERVLEEAAAGEKLRADIRHFLDVVALKDPTGGAQ